MQPMAMTMGTPRHYTNMNHGAMAITAPLMGIDPYLSDLTNPNNQSGEVNNAIDDKCNQGTDADTAVTFNSLYKGTVKYSPHNLFTSLTVDDSSKPVTVVTTSTSNMLTTTIVTTTCAAVLVSATPSGTQQLASATTSVTTTVTEDQVHGKPTVSTPVSATTPNTTTNGEMKRKKPESDMSPLASSVKKRITEETQTDGNPLVGNDSDEMMKRMYKEIIEIKEMVSQVNLKVDNMQAENKIWTEKLTKVESELGEVQDSVNMAHDLIKDETETRKSETSAIKKLMVQIK